jgi:hypothetical protein
MMKKECVCCGIMFDYRASDYCSKECAENILLGEC